MELPREILFIIIEFCDPLSRLRFTGVDKIFYNCFEIHDLMNIPEMYLMKLTDEILQQARLKNLKKLRVNKRITQKGILNFNLIELNISNNENIYDVAFMDKLKKLCASSCKIKQSGIFGLDLIELNANYTETIFNVFFMKNLKILYANGNWQIRFLIKTDLANNKEPLSARYMWY